MDGILLVDKPSGMTSHDVIDTIRRRFGLRKVGHTGTLDPLATGLLVILIGKSTKKAKDFINDDKTYLADLILGISTDTGDIEGNIVKKRHCSIDKATLSEVLGKFEGEIFQVPPMFSAKKIKGKKLYEYARRGIEIEREPKKVIIRKIDIINFKKNKLSLKISCSKGTYIRQLAIDIGKDMDCGACVFRLRRITSGRFAINDCIKFDELINITREGLCENILRNQ